MTLPDPRLANSLFLRTNLSLENEAKMKAAVDSIVSLVGQVPATVELNEMLRYLCRLKVADTTLSGISAGRAALGEAAPTTAASFAELSTAFTLLPPDIARIVFPAASFKPLQPDTDASSTTLTVTASVLECGSPHRTALAIGRVREHLCAILRARSVLYGDSMSLTQLATLAAAKEEYVCK